MALAQDTIVSEAYDAFPECVLHGGTAIWRCYGGGRFSEDIGVYLPVDEAVGSARFRSGLAAKGMKELEYKTTENTVFGKYEAGGVVVSFEAALRGPPASVVRAYEVLDGTLMLVKTLTPDDLLLEKAAAYTSRRKVRDLYDVFFLLNLVEDGNRVRPAVSRMLKSYAEPVDAGQLRATIIAGVVPSAEAMLEGIERWARRSTSTR